MNSLVSNHACSRVLRNWLNEACVVDQKKTAMNSKELKKVVVVFLIIDSSCFCFLIESFACIKYALLIIEMIFVKGEKTFLSSKKHHPCDVLWYIVGIVLSTLSWSMFSSCYFLEFVDEFGVGC